MATLTLRIFATILLASEAEALMSPAVTARHATARRRAPCPTAGRKGRPQMPSGAMPSPSQQQMQDPEAPPDGQSLFYLYCRTKSRVMWYPVSVMRGDGQSKGLISAWLGSPFAKGVFKNRLDEGMARSIFDSERRLTDMARKQYPSLKKMTSLEWGFKIVDKDVMAKEAAGEIEPQKIIYVTKDMVKDTWQEQMKQTFNL